MMRGLIQRTWRWLACNNNRGRVMVIATVVGVLIAGMTFVALLQTPASEVRMSVSGFQDALERRAEEVRIDLATAHGEERIRLQNEIAEVARQLADLQAAYSERQQRAGEVESSLVRLSTHVDDDGLADARTALDAGDFSKADDLLEAIEARAAVTVAHAAEAAFRRGQIAATQIRWGEAAIYFDKAARLDPVYEHLKLAGSFAWRSGRYPAALRHIEDLLELSRREYGERSPETGTALNMLATVLADAGRYEEAEPLHRQALEIGRETLGQEHPDYAARLNNLATLLAEAGRYEEAEPLYRQALEIGRETLGKRHPDYAIRVNNFANLLAKTGRYEKAERLYRQALEIGRETLGEGHPNYATALNNFAAFLMTTGRYEEAAPLYRQALEIGRETLGEGHPDHADRLNNLANLLVKKGQHEEAERLYRQALEIVRDALGDDHAKTRGMAWNHAWLLRAQFPDSLELDELRAAFGEDIGLP